MLVGSIPSEYPGFPLVKLQNFHSCLQIPEANSTFCYFWTSFIAFYQLSVSRCAFSKNSRWIAFDNRDLFQKFIEGLQKKGGVSNGDVFFERRILKLKEVFYLSYC